MKLIKNSARCKNCGDILESKHRHDYVTCTCFQESSEKRHEFIETFKEIFPNSSEIMWIELELNHPSRGIMIDGGLDYQRYSAGKDFIDLSEWEPE